MNLQKSNTRALNGLGKWQDGIGNELVGQRTIEQSNFFSGRLDTWSDPSGRQNEKSNRWHLMPFELVDTWLDVVGRQNGCAEVEQTAIHGF